MDFWLPRREGNRGTEITTLQGGQNLDQIKDIEYFQEKLYKSLNVPVSRLNPETSGFSIGRTTEVTRDELKFTKFVDRLRSKFSDLFNQALKTQCVLKGICTADEWEEFKQHITYDFIEDNNFAELKEAELMKERLGLLGAIDPYTGRYFSQTWIQRNVLRLTDDQIKEMQEEMDEEKEMGLGLPTEVMSNVAQQQMMGDVQGDQQAAMTQFNAGIEKDKAEHASELEKLADKSAQKNEASGTFGKLKQIL